jgi:hypothetical protein
MIFNAVERVRAWLEQPNAPLDEELRMHAVASLAQAGEWELIRSLLTDFSPSQRWAEARFAAEGSYSGYLSDLELLWQHSEQQHDLVLVLRCALIVSRVSDPIERLHPNSLVEVMTALRYTHALPEPERSEIQEQTYQYLVSRSSVYPLGLSLAAIVAHGSNQELRWRAWQQMLETDVYEWAIPIVVRIDSLPPAMQTSFVEHIWPFIEQGHSYFCSLLERCARFLSIEQQNILRQRLLADPSQAGASEVFEGLVAIPTSQPELLALLVDFPKLGGSYKSFRNLARYLDWKQHPEAIELVIKYFSGFNWRQLPLDDLVPYLPESDLTILEAWLAPRQLQYDEHLVKEEDEFYWSTWQEDFYKYLIYLVPYQSPASRQASLDYLYRLVTRYLLKWILGPSKFFRVEVILTQVGSYFTEEQFQAIVDQLVARYKEIPIDDEYMHPIDFVFKVLVPLVSDADVKRLFALIADRPLSSETLGFYIAFSERIPEIVEQSLYPLVLEVLEGNDGSLEDNLIEVMPYLKREDQIRFMPQALKYIFRIRPWGDEYEAKIPIVMETILQNKLVGELTIEPYIREWPTDRFIINQLVSCLPWFKAMAEASQQPKLLADIAQSVLEVKEAYR